MPARGLVAAGGVVVGGVVVVAGEVVVGGVVVAPGSTATAAAGEPVDEPMGVRGLGLHHVILQCLPRYFRFASFVNRAHQSSQCLPSDVRLSHFPPPRRINLTLVDDHLPPF